MPDLNNFLTSESFPYNYLPNARITSSLEAFGQLFSLLTTTSPAKGYELKLFRSTVYLRFSSRWSLSRRF